MWIRRGSRSPPMRSGGRRGSVLRLARCVSGRRRRCWRRASSTTFICYLPTIVAMTALLLAILLGRMPDLIVVTAPAIRRRCRFPTTVFLRLCFGTVTLTALCLTFSHSDMDDLSINTAPALRILMRAAMFVRFFLGGVTLATLLLAVHYSDLEDLAVIAAPTLRRRLRWRRRSSGRLTML
jgi:hypothetical protein